MRKSWRRKGQRISRKNRLLIYLNSILLHFLQWRWESNFALRETVTASSWKGRSSPALLFFLLCLLRAGFTITKKAEAGSCRLPGSREELCLAGRPWGPLQGQRWFSLSPKTSRKDAGTEAMLCSRSQRQPGLSRLLHHVWPDFLLSRSCTYGKCHRAFHLGWASCQLALQLFKL